jgi:nucleoid DNA-binding protein
MAATKPARKAPAKKAPAATPAARTKPAPKAGTAKPATATRKVTAISEKFTKSQILNELSTNTGLSKRQVSEVLDELGTVIERHIKKRAVGEFTMPGLFKIKTVEKPARKARKGINPFTGEETTFKARPRSTAVKIQPLKALKDMAK